MAVNNPPPQPPPPFQQKQQRQQQRQQQQQHAPCPSSSHTPPPPPPPSREEEEEEEHPPPLPSFPQPQPPPPQPQPPPPQPQPPPPQPQPPSPQPQQQRRGRRQTYDQQGADRHGHIITHSLPRPSGCNLLTQTPGSPAAHRYDCNQLQLQQHPHQQHRRRQRRKTAEENSYNHHYHSNNNRRRPRENHSYASTRSPSGYNSTCNANSESRDLSSASRPKNHGSLNRSSFRDCEEREEEVNADCSPGKVGGVRGSPRDTKKDELEDLLRSKLCLAGKTFLLAVVEESLEGDLCDRIAGLGGSTARSGLDGGTYAVLTDLKLDLELHCWYVDFSDRCTVRCAVKRYRNHLARARRLGSKEEEGVCVRQSRKDDVDDKRDGRSAALQASPVSQSMISSVLEMPGLPPGRGREMVAAAQQHQQQHQRQDEQLQQRQLSPAHSRPRPPTPYPELHPHDPFNPLLQPTPTGTKRRQHATTTISPRTPHIPQHPSPRTPSSAQIPEPLRAFLTAKEYLACLHVAEEEGEKVGGAELMGLEVLDARTFLEEQVTQQHDQVWQVMRKLSERRRRQVFSRLHQDNKKISIRVEDVHQLYRPSYSSFDTYPRDQLNLPSGPPPPHLPPPCHRDGATVDHSDNDDDDDDDDHHHHQGKCQDVPEDERRSRVKEDGAGEFGDVQNVFDGVKQEQQHPGGAERSQGHRHHFRYGVVDDLPRGASDAQEGACAWFKEEDVEKAADESKGGDFESKSRRRLFPEEHPKLNKNTNEVQASVFTNNYVRDPTPNQPRFTQGRVGAARSQQARVKGQEGSDVERPGMYSWSLRVDNSSHSPQRPNSNQPSPKDKNNNDIRQAGFNKTREKKGCESHRFEHVKSKFRRRKDSFCEICRQEYHVLVEHVEVTEHLNIAGSSQLYRELNQFLCTFPSMETYLQTLMDHHQKYNNVRENCTETKTAMVSTSTTAVTTASIMTISTNNNASADGTISVDKACLDHRELTLAEEVTGSVDEEVFRTEHILPDEAKPRTTVANEAIDTGHALADDVHKITVDGAACRVDEYDDDTELYTVGEYDAETELIPPSVYSMFPLVNAELIPPSVYSMFPLVNAKLIPPSVYSMFPLVNAELIPPSVYSMFPVVNAELAGDVAGTMQLHEEAVERAEVDNEQSIGWTPSVQPNCKTSPSRVKASASRRARRRGYGSTPSKEANNGVGIGTRATSTRRQRRQAPAQQATIDLLSSARAVAVKLRASRFFPTGLSRRFPTPENRPTLGESSSDLTISEQLDLVQVYSAETSADDRLGDGWELADQSRLTAVVQEHARNVSAATQGDVGEGLRNGHELKGTSVCYDTIPRAGRQQSQSRPDGCSRGTQHQQVSREPGEGIACYEPPRRVMVGEQMIRSYNQHGTSERSYNQHGTSESQKDRIVAEKTKPEMSSHSEKHLKQNSPNCSVTEPAKQDSLQSGPNGSHQQSPGLLLKQSASALRLHPESDVRGNRQMPRRLTSSPEEPQHKGRNLATIIETDPAPVLNACKSNTLVKNTSKAQTPDNKSPAAKSADRSCFTPCNRSPKTHTPVKNAFKTDSRVPKNSGPSLRQPLICRRHDVNYTPLSDGDATACVVSDVPTNTREEVAPEKMHPHEASSAMDTGDNSAKRSRRKLDSLAEVTVGMRSRLAEERKNGDPDHGEIRTSRGTSTRAMRSVEQTLQKSPGQSGQLTSNAISCGKQKKQKRRKSEVDGLDFTIAGFSFPEDTGKTSIRNARQHNCNVDSPLEDVLEASGEFAFHKQPELDQPTEASKEPDRNVKTRSPLRVGLENLPLLEERTKNTRQTPQQPKHHQHVTICSSSGGKDERNMDVGVPVHSRESGELRKTPTVPPERRKIQRRLLKELEDEVNKQPPSRHTQASEPLTAHPEENRFYVEFHAESTHPFHQGVRGQTGLRMQREGRPDHHGVSPARERSRHQPESGSLQGRTPGFSCRAEGTQRRGSLRQSRRSSRQRQRREDEKDEVDDWKPLNRCRVSTTSSLSNPSSRSAPATRERCAGEEKNLHGRRARQERAAVSGAEFLGSPQQQGNFDFVETGLKAWTSLEAGACRVAVSGLAVPGTRGDPEGQAHDEHHDPQTPDAREKAADSESDWERRERGRRRSKRKYESSDTPPQHRPRRTRKQRDSHAGRSALTQRALDDGGADRRENSDGLTTTTPHDSARALTSDFGPPGKARSGVPEKLQALAAPSGVGAPSEEGGNQFRGGQSLRRSSRRVNKQPSSSVIDDGQRSSFATPCAGRKPEKACGQNASRSRTERRNMSATEMDSLRRSVRRMDLDLNPEGGREGSRWSTAGQRSATKESRGRRYREVTEEQRREVAALARTFGALCRLSEASAAHAGE